MEKDRRTAWVVGVLWVLACVCGAVHAEERAIAGTVRADGTWIKQGDVAEIGDYYALIIAIDKYGPEEWRLRTPVADGKALAKLLKADYGFKEVVELYDDQATFLAIRSAIGKLGRKVAEKDSVLIYYAGHGVLERDTGFWVPADAKPREEWTYLRHIVIRDMIKRQAFKARHVLVVSDSCYAAGMFRSATIPERVLPEYVRQALRKPARQLLTS